MARYECVRCDEVCFTTDDEHICKDIRQRLQRRENQIKATIGLLNSEFPHPNQNNEYRRMVAEKIVTVLANMGVTED